jgi:hypothetical protein
MRCQSVALREVVKQANGVKEPVLLPHKPLHNFVEAHFTWCGKGLVEPFLNQRDSTAHGCLSPARGRDNWHGRPFLPNKERLLPPQA